jgi:hypothetical protein
MGAAVAALVLFLQPLAGRAATMPVAPPPSNVPVVTKTVDIKLGDGKFPLTYRVYLVPMADTKKIRIRVVADLSGLQKQVPDYLAGLASAKNKDCGDRFFAKSVTVTPSAPGVDIASDARYERWACADLHYPEFRGLKVRMSKKRASTRLLKQSGSIGITLTPVVTPASVALTATAADVKLDGVGGDFARSLGLEGKLSDDILNSINKGLGGDGARLKLPKDIEKLDIRFVDARFLSLSKKTPALGFALTAEVTATPALFKTLYDKFVAPK